MASAEREPIMWVWGAVTPVGSGAKPLVGGGFKGRSSPEAVEILANKTASLR